MVVNGRPLKRAKSRVAAASPLDLIPNNQPIDLDAIADLRDARRASDLISPRGSLDLIGPRGVLDLDLIDADVDVGRPFRESVRVFSKYGRMMQIPAPAGGAPPNLMTWKVQIRASGVEVELCVVDEDVIRSNSVYCDQCRVVGWSGHPVCAKRYHFIIRNENRATAAAALSSSPRTGCLHCGSTLLVSESRCMTCKLEGKGADQDHVIQLDDVSHLLHAVVHSNGYGHLLRVNGHQGGSKHLTGNHIMSFWDCLCKFLHVRKVTVMDISKKHGMEYRLLHSVMAGHPWYGEWGYEFGAGSYGVNATLYHEAVETLSNLPLSLFSPQNRTPQTQLQDLISLYKSLSDQKLTTIRDLFKYITNLLHESNAPLSKLLKTSARRDEWDCDDDVELVKRGMVRVLRAVGRGKWVGWRALRGATSKAAKSGDVLDRSLKELGGKTTEDGFVVAARCNSQTNTLEYRLEAATNQQSVVDSTAFSKPSPSQLLRDLKLLFNSLLNPSTTEPYKPQLTRTLALKSASVILDCKQFLKSYNDPCLTNPLPLNPFMLHVWCVVELIDCPKDYTNPPPELLVISASATISDLKLQASRTFQEIYPLFQGFLAESVVTNVMTSESALVKHVINPNEIIRVKGRCLGLGEKLGLYRMERGLENWTVECECGARDDDGERMMACDTCGVWQHTRCSGVKDSDDVPAVFVCVKCVKKNKGKMKEMEIERKCGNVNSKKVGMVSQCVYNV